MSEIGNWIMSTIRELENGDVRGEYGWGIKSKDLRRYLKNMGSQLTNTEESFQVMGEKIQQTFLGHFTDEEGPDPLNNDQMTKWSPYNEPLDEKQESYIERKERQGLGNKLMRLSGFVEHEITDKSNIKIKKGNNPGLEVSTDAGWGIFGHTGFTGKNGHPTPEDTKRPIFNLSPEEENDIINEMMDEFWRKVEE